MNQAMQPRVFVDGNNVMGSRADGWWRDRGGAARRIAAEIALLARSRGGCMDDRVRWAGAARHGTVAGECLTVVHAGHGGRDSADDRIVELVGALPDRTTALVYTSDAGLRSRVHAMGAQVAGAQALLKKGIAAVRGTTEPSTNGGAIAPPPPPPPASGYNRDHVFALRVTATHCRAGCLFPA